MTDKTLNYLFHEILEKVLHLSNNPAHFAEYLSLQIRELVGVRTILIAIQDENEVSKIYSVYPLRKKEWAQQPAIFELIDLSFYFPNIEIWNKYTDNERIVQSLNALEIEKAISIPLIVAEKIIGSILLLDIMDMYGIDEMMKVLADLSGVFALIVRNSILYKNLENQIEIRTVELQRRNEELAEKEYRLQQILKNAPIPFMVHAENGEVIQINDAWSEISGYNFSEISTTSDWTERAYHEKKSLVDKDLEKLYGIKEKFHDGEYPIFTKSGDQKIWDFISSPLGKLPDGRRMVISMATDITDRKQNEKALLESEIKYRNLVENSPDAIAIYTAREIVYVNKECLTLMRAKSESELIGMHVIEFVHPDSRKFVIERMSKVLIEGKFLTLAEEKFIRLDGTACDVDVKAIPITFEGHQAVQIIVRDISERKEAELQLLEREVQYWNLANSGMALIWTSGPDKLCTYFNETWLKFTGRNLEVELGNGWAEGVHPDDFDDCLKTYITAFDKREAFSMEYRLRHVSGEYKWLIDMGTPNYNSNKEFVGYIGHCLDITERKQAEESLKKSEEKLNMLFTSMTEMVVMHELVVDEHTNAIDYRILECNDTFTNITGIRREDAVGKLATEVYQTVDAPYLKEYTKAVITGNSYEFDSYYEPMDKHFIISVVSIGENMFATISTDISDIQKAQKELKRKNQELENYIYVASHDLRSPLVNIQGFSQRLEKQTEKLNTIIANGVLDETNKQEISKITHEDVPKSLNFILNNVAKMDTLINGLLHLSRTGRIVLNIKKLDMNKLVNDVLKSFNFQLTECNAQLDIPHLSDCYGDVNQINQVFSNIIGNAIKYRDSNRKLVIEITSKAEINRVSYSIKDNGIGINERQLEKIWDIFYRVDSSSSEVGEGIGLSLARRIVEKHKGKIWAESEINVGSVFHIELQKNHFES